jgi:arylsulfatase A-like enzyme
MRIVMLPFLLAAVLSARAADTPAGARPNIVFILADDLAMGDLGCYGQKKIRTPSLDRLASEGTRFTQAYTGTSVCAPARTSLMTGLHMGHAPVRANRKRGAEGQMPLPEGTVTVAGLLRQAGYATAVTGKWGMGMFDTPGSPLKVGFDHFFGYNCQTHAHDYFPKHLYRDAERFELDGKTYAQNLIADDTLAWVRKQKDRPFFLYVAWTLPHGKYEIDDLGEYAKTDWTPQQKTYAAMVSRLDRDVGRLVALLRELGVERNTLVMFAGDNGSSFAPESDIGRFFDPSCGLRGFKRGLYEGGLRQAALAWWPGTVPAGRVSDGPWAFWDFLPTAAELAGAALPAGFKPDGLSLVPYLRGGPAPARECFYWELHEGKFIQALRMGDWKAVRSGAGAPLELYDLKTDPGERQNAASAHPDVVAKAEALMKASRVDDPEWPVKAAPERKAGLGGKAKQENP